MKNARNEQVVQAWADGRSAESSTGNLWTDGDMLYSYSRPIGYRNSEGERVVILYRGRHFLSQTTACHVGLALRVADADHEPWERSTAPGTGMHAAPDTWNR